VGSGENVRSIDRSALGLVDGGGVAVVQVFVELGIHRHTGSGFTVELDLKHAAFDGA